MLVLSLHTLTGSIMGLHVLRFVFLAFIFVFICGLVNILGKLPAAGGNYFIKSISSRTQAYEMLNHQVVEEIVIKEQYLRALIDGAVDVMAEGNDASARHLRFETSDLPASPSSAADQRIEEEQELSVIRGKGHPILEATDTALINTPLSELWAKYGDSKGDPNCERDLGYGLLEAWRSTNASYCSPHDQGDSELQCFLIHQNHHAGGGDNLCLATNVRMDFREIANEKVTRRTMDSYISSRHSDAAWIHYGSGLMAGTCEKNARLFQKSAFPGWNEDMIYNGFQSLPARAQTGGKTLNEALQCDVWIDHPVLLVERDTFANFFHDSEDFVNAFLAIAVLEWKLKDVQVFLLDLYPDGPFWDMWFKVFQGKEYPPKMAWDIEHEFGSQNVCFKQVAMGIYGPAAPTTLASFKTECEHSTLVRAYSDLVIRGMGLQHLTHYAQDMPSKTVTVTWMARRASVIWPERNFCSEDSFFKCQDFAHLDVRKLGRMVRNDAEVVQALKRLESESFANGAQVVVQDVDFNLLSFEEQMKVDLATDIMIGPHGAGLMHNIFLRDRGVLMELFIDGSGTNKHFHNLAKWYGRRYIEMPQDNPVSIEAVLQSLRQEIGRIDLTKW